MSKKILREGAKFDESKLRYDLVPVLSLEAWARVLTYGANKYAPRNWEKGIRWGRCYAATMRHLQAWWRGEDFDPESRYHHLAHVMCNIGFLLEFRLTHPELDDRPPCAGSPKQKNLPPVDIVKVLCELLESVYGVEAIYEESFKQLSEEFLRKVRKE